jgi:hypothetical protein
MKYATEEEKKSPENINVPIINGKMARFMLYTKFHFSAFSRINSKDETRIAIPYRN